MAISITQSPQSFTPSDNPVVWVFNSDQTSNPNFYFLVDVMINGVSVENHKVYPEQGGYAHFDASSITERYAFVNTRQQSQTLNYISIDVTEYYNGSAGLTDTSNEVKIFKAKVKKEVFQNWNANDYVLDGVGTTKFLTFCPRGDDKTKGTELKYISLLSDGNAPNVEFKTYTSGGTLIDTQNLNLATTENLFSITVGVQDLIDDISLDFTGATYYTLQATNTSGSTEIYRINIDTDCNYSKAKRLHFLNSLGGIDSFTFGLFSRERASVKSFGYERQFGNFDSSNYFTFDLKEGTVIDYLKQFNKSIEITSDWLTEDVQNWLVEELYTSPIAYIESGTELYRCKVTNDKYEMKGNENDMLFQEVVKIELESDTSVNV